MYRLFFSVHKSISSKDLQRVKKYHFFVGFYRLSYFNHNPVPPSRHVPRAKVAIVGLVVGGGWVQTPQTP